MSNFNGNDPGPRQRYAIKQNSKGQCQVDVTFEKTGDDAKRNYTRINTDPTDPGKMIETPDELVVVDMVLKIMKTLEEKGFETVGNPMKNKNRVPKTPQDVVNDLNTSGL